MHEEAVSREIILLIERLAEDKDISRDFYLAGGIALALHLGHRLSNDIDLFSQKRLNVDQIVEKILSIEGRISEQREDTVISFINDIKTSFFYYPYKLVMPLKYFKGLPVASVEDIACMKIIALSQRGDKRDFYDIYEILKYIPMEKIKGLLLEKYSENAINFYHIMKSLCYFEEAEKQPQPISLNNTSWEEVKEFFIKNERMFSKLLIGI